MPWCIRMLGRSYHPQNLTTSDVNIGLKQATWFLLISGDFLIFNYNLINPERLPNYDVPTSSCLNRPSKPVVNDPFSDEQHCKNNESYAVLFNEDTAPIESEVAEKMQKNAMCLFSLINLCWAPSK